MRTRDRHLPPASGSHLGRAARQGRVCDDVGIDSVWFADHLYPPMLPEVPSFEAWTTAAALAPLTKRIRLGHLVLCNGVPASGAAGQDGGDARSRLRWQIRSRSRERVVRAGVRSLRPRVSAARASAAAQLGEALTVIRRLFTEARVTFDGTLLHAARCAEPAAPASAARTLRSTSAAPASATRYRWSRDTRTCGIARPTRWPNCRASSKRCAPLAPRSGAIPRVLRVTEEAVLALVERRDQIEAARALAERRFGGPGWGFAAGGYCGTPDDIIARIARAASARGRRTSSSFCTTAPQPDTAAPARQRSAAARC